MKGEKAQRSKFFQIPIKKYEEDMKTKSAKEKKKEILELFTNSNKLRSEEEFKEIKQKLHYACREGNVALIQIYLSETIENDSKSLKFKIDRENRTASLFKVNDNIKDIVIPRTVKHESMNYLITSIISTSANISSIKFVEDSAVRTLHRDAFPPYSQIEDIYFPSCLKELKEGWCCFTCKLKKIEVSPSNDQFIMKEDKYLLGKSDTYKDEFDVLLFACRDIKEISIPPNIKIISSYAFTNCCKLKKVEIPPNSHLQTIGEYAFFDSNIKEIFIPPNVSKICENALFNCVNLVKVEILPNSNLQTIEGYAFSYSKIKEIVIPPNVSKICENAFFNCGNLVKVEIPPNSNLHTIGKGAFSFSNIAEIYFPSGLKELNEGWCQYTNKLTKIEISPSNDQFIMKEDKYLLGKSDTSKDEFDVLLFACRDIKEISIPPNIKIISSYAFSECRNLTKVEISVNSNLQTIRKSAFSYSKIKEIFIPSKVSKICEKTFNNCDNLTKVEIPPNSNLQAFGEYAFSFSNIKEICIPSKVSIIYDYAFYYCKNLQIIEIHEASELELISLRAFDGCRNILIMGPSNIIKQKVQSDISYCNILL